LQKAQIALVGESETIQPAEGFEEVRVTDPVSGRTYAAYRDPAAANPGSFLGAKLLEQLQLRVDELNALPEGSPDIARARAIISNQTEEIEILRSLYLQFQLVFVAN
jgi:hypothetical protein